MSNFQTNTLFGAILIAVFWLIFCISLLGIDIYVGVLGAISSICIGLWIGWSQKWMGFVGGVLSMITALGFIFSVIPVYTYNASLNSFYAGEVPSIICDTSTQGDIIIDTIRISMSEICKRSSFPILTEQTIEIKTDKAVLIDLAMGRSAIVPPEYKGVIKRTIEEGIPQYNFDTKVPEITNQQVTNQETIKQLFLKKKREYLQKNYPRKREYAPTITKIAIRKMRLLSLIDRSYDEKIERLEFYMREVK